MKISSHYEHDSRHFTFVRNSKLPYGTFTEDRINWSDRIILVIAIAILVAIVIGLLS